MKKLLTISLVSILVISLSSIASAQIGPVGIKAGMNLADLGGDAENTNMKSGLVIGAFANFSLGVINIQPELLYSMKGAKQEIPSTGEEYDEELNYFEVPILVKYNLPLPGKLTPSLYAGPCISFLMSAEYNGEDIKDNIKSTDYSLIVGAGVNMDLDAYVLTFDARYNLGLADINDVDDGGDEGKLKNSAIMLMAGIGFNLPGM